MMSLNELQDQISADEKVLTDSIVTDERDIRWSLLERRAPEIFEAARQAD